MKYLAAAGFLLAVGLVGPAAAVTVGPGGIGDSTAFTPGTGAAIGEGSVTATLPTASVVYDFTISAASLLDIATGLENLPALNFPSFTQRSGNLDFVSVVMTSDSSLGVTPMSLPAPSCGSPTPCISNHVGVGTQSQFAVSYALTDLVTTYHLTITRYISAVNTTGSNGWGGSMNFYGLPPGVNTIPLPPALALFASVVFGGGFFARRRSQHRKTTEAVTG